MYTYTHSQPSDYVCVKSITSEGLLNTIKRSMPMVGLYIEILPREYVQSGLGVNNKSFTSNAYKGFQYVACYCLTIVKAQYVHKQLHSHLHVTSLQSILLVLASTIAVCGFNHQGRFLLRSLFAVLLVGFPVVVYPATRPLPVLWSLGGTNHVESCGALVNRHDDILQISTVI